MEITFSKVKNDGRTRVVTVYADGVEIGSLCQTIYGKGFYQPYIADARLVKKMYGPFCDGDFVDIAFNKPLAEIKRFVTRIIKIRAHL